MLERLDEIEERYYEKRRFLVGDVLWLISIIRGKEPFVSHNELDRLKEENAALKLHIAANEKELIKYRGELLGKPVEAVRKEQNTSTGLGTGRALPR